MSLDYFFNPKTVAVIGASRDPKKVGHCIFRNFVQSRYKNRVYPVNPNAKKILGIKCYPSVKAIKEPVDLAVIAVSASIVPKVTKECVEKVVKGIIVITSGFSEIGEEGKKREEQIKKVLKGSKTRLIGVNCLGVYDPYSEINTLFMPEFKIKLPKKGEIAFITQSGAFGSTQLDMLAAQGLGISKFISYGNQTDVTDIELLRYLKEDPRTKVIVIYLEGVSNGREFLKTTKEITKPIIVFKAGKTKKGSEATVSHTGSLAGSYQIYNAAFKQANLIQAFTVEQIFDYAKALAYQPPAKGDRIVVITNGGGYGVIAADSIINNGLKLADFSKSVERDLRKFMPPYANITNPLDLIGDADAERYQKALEVLVSDKNIDGFIVITLLQTVSLESKVVQVLTEFNQRTDKPIVVCSTGSKYTQKHLRVLEKHRIPTYSSPDRAVKAMKALVDYGKKFRS